MAKAKDETGPAVDVEGFTDATTPEEALEVGYLGSVHEDAIKAAEYADLSNGIGYMGGPPKGEIVAE